MKRIKKLYKRSQYPLAGIMLIYLVLLAYPGWLFAHDYEYKNFSVHADQAIPASIEPVLDEVERLISASELYEASDRFDIYICHDQRRFTFFTRNPQAGGVVNFVLSPNVFIRACDIDNNEIKPAAGWMYTREERPLSYYMAHEITHAMQRKVDRTMPIHKPVHIVEGYADYVGKARHFEYERYKNDFLNDAHVMQPESRLYNKYHLYISYLMDKKGYTFAQVLEEELPLSILEELKPSDGAN